VELGIGLLVEVEGDGGEAAADDVLEDRIGRPADVGGDADLLRLEVSTSSLWYGAMNSR
jgi:hypothetical protein